jgi:serine/threonine protein kinase
VLVFEGLHVKLADLGLSRKVSVQEPPSIGTTASDLSLLDSCLSKGRSCTSNRFISSITGCGVGTWAYMAPEVGTGGSISSMSDMYSFGMTCVHIVFGRMINGGVASLILQLEQHLLDCYGRYRDEGVDVDALIEFVTRCLSIDSNKRPTARECAECFETLQNTMVCDETHIERIMLSLS